MSQQRAHRDPAPLEEYLYPILTKASGRTTKMLAVGVFMVIASGYLIYRGIREGDYMLSITGGSFFGILACVAFGTLPRAKQTAPFRYLNGEVMSKAERPVLDTWVHLAPTRPLRVTAVIGVVPQINRSTPMPPSQTSCLPRSFLR